MKRIISTIVFSIWLSYGYGQTKPPVTFDCFSHWPEVLGDPKISANGEFVMTLEDNGFSGDSLINEKLILRSTRNDWRLTMPDAGYGSEVVFTPDSRHFIFRTKNKQVGIVELGKTRISYINNVSVYRLLGNILVYTTKDSLVIVNLGSGHRSAVTGVSGFQAGPKGIELVFQTTVSPANTVALVWYDLLRNKQHTIWHGKALSGLVFSDDGKQVAYLSQDSAKNSLWLYQTGGKQAVLLNDGHLPTTDSTLHLGGIDGFSGDGNYLFFYLERVKNSVVKKNGTASLNVWSYRDNKLQSQQLKELHIPQKYLAVIDLHTGSAAQLENDSDRVFEKYPGFVLINHDTGMYETRKTDVVLFFLKNGQRKALSAFNDFVVSPTGKYLINYDFGLNGFVSYNTITGAVKQLTRNISTDWQPYQNNRLLGAPPVSLARWIKGDARLFLPDQYDIWMIDPEGEQAPVNVTNGYGHTNQTAFKIIGHYGTDGILPGERLILSAFNRSNKQNGFFSKTLGKPGDPIKLIMGDAVFCANEDDIADGGMEPVKASHSSAYVVRMMSASEAPNFFFTKDFKSFSPLSAIYPERQYNWLTTELVAWQSLDGRELQGVLYKPEIFDPAKKYPLIIYYYEKMSANLNVYIKPRYSEGALDIPYFVSNGYLVFTPDIRYQIAEPGKSALDAVVSAATYLSGLPYIDGAHIGIQGHSFGGYETNYIVTHSSLFAAACSGAGVSDLISDYDNIWGYNGAGHQALFETGQMRMGKTLWEIPVAYIQNSPVLYADHVKTPVLLMNNAADEKVPFSQGLEFFSALRRLGKKAWLLDYDDGDHTVNSEPDQRDFTTRMKQFFDYYLKGGPPPLWMTRGVPAALKEVDTGLEYDYSGAKP